MKINNTVEKTLDYITLSFFVILLLLLTVNVFLRIVPIYNLSWFDDAVEFSFAWLVFLGAANLWYKKEHSRVDFVPEKYKGKLAGYILDVTNEFFGLLFALLFTYYGFVLFSRLTALSPILQVPKKFFYLSMPVSGILMIIYSIDHLIQDTRKLIKFTAKNKVEESI